MAAGFMSRIDPRISMAFGFGLQTVAGLWMLTFDLNVTMEILVVNSAIQGFAVGVVWVPITVVAFDTLDAKDYAEASSIFHLLRNIGSSFFISLSIAEIVRTTGANYSRMTEMITPYNRALGDAGRDGAWNFDTVPGLARVAKEIMRQSVDDRLSQCVHDVHGGVGAGGRVRPHGPAPKGGLVLRRHAGLAAAARLYRRTAFVPTTTWAKRCAPSADRSGVIGRA